MEPSGSQILVIGGTGAQGMPVVKSLSESRRYRVRVLTRSLESSRAKQLANVTLQNVTLMQRAQDNQQDLHKAFRGVYGAWVNTDGFTLGEKNELFHVSRAYEIARSEGVQHYVWTISFGEKYHYSHMDSTGRIGKFILAQGQEEMNSSLFSTGPYIDMLTDGLFVPVDQPDGPVLGSQLDAKLPLIALDDVGIYGLWLFDDPSESGGLDLSVITDEVSFDDIARIFTEVTGKQGVYKSVPFRAYAVIAEPYPGASVN
ncbi:NmrA family protein [Ilyonectria destructans]|nr:NmrA family protein [Ilyonectria destructans]